MLRWGWRYFYLSIGGSYSRRSSVEWVLDPYQGYGLPLGVVGFVRVSVAVTVTIPIIPTGTALNAI